MGADHVGELASDPEPVATVGLVGYLWFFERMPRLIYPLWADACRRNGVNDKSLRALVQGSRVDTERDNQVANCCRQIVRRPRDLGLAGVAFVRPRAAYSGFRSVTAHSSTAPPEAAGRNLPSGVKPQHSSRSPGGSTGTRKAFPEVRSHSLNPVPASCGLPAARNRPSGESAIW